MDARDTTVTYDKDGNKEHPPKYIGGVQGFLTTLTRTFKYPDIRTKFAPSGRVMVSFVIEMDGKMSLTEVNTSQLVFNRKTPEEVIETFKKDVIAEVERTLTVMEPWVPGIQKGLPVRVKMKMPLNMTLD